MDTLLVEDLLLITAHPTRGTVRRPTGIALPRALAGATVDDLLARRAAILDGDRLVLSATPGTPHRLLQHAWDRLAARNLGVDQAIERLAAPRTRLGQHLLHSLTAGGAVEHRDRRLLGLLPGTSHRVTDPDAVRALRSRVAAALPGSVGDARAGALAAMVSAGDLHRVVHLDAGAAGRGRGRSPVPHDPVAAAVARTVARARRDAATTAAVAATAGAVAASGS